jgi:hypothetical protein
LGLFQINKLNGPPSLYASLSPAKSRRDCARPYADDCSRPSAEVRRSRKQTLNAPDERRGIAGLSVRPSRAEPMAISYSMRLR